MAAASRWPYDEKRLLDDQTYNVQLGAAELGDLIKYYRGSYILAFAGYNAGRGRVKEIDFLMLLAMRADQALPIEGTA